jgi:hypothetical protein
MRALPWCPEAARVKRIALCQARRMDPTARDYDALAAE